MQQHSLSRERDRERNRERERESRDRSDRSDRERERERDRSLELRDSLLGQALEGGPTLIVPTQVDNSFFFTIFGFKKQTTKIYSKKIVRQKKLTDVSTKDGLKWNDRQTTIPFIIP